MFRGPSVKGPLRDALRKSGTLELIGDHIFMSNQAAIEYYETIRDDQTALRPYKEYTHQTN